MKNDRVLILDFGSQTTQLIARRVRELNVYCEILPYHVDEERILEFAPAAIILSGGPASVKWEKAQHLPKAVLDLDVHVLGICYGMQIVCQSFGGDVDAHEEKEFGQAIVRQLKPSLLFEQVPALSQVWMSHGDQVHKLPQGFETLAQSDTCPHAAVYSVEKKFYGVQFHPEVMHSVDGTTLLSNFLFRIAKVQASWESKNWLVEKIAHIKAQVGSKHVLMGLSGGVDSSVAATLIHQAIGDQLDCLYVDHGLSREGEVEEIKNLFADQYHIRLRIVDAKSRFFEALAGVEDPESKRKIAGRMFVEVFEEEAKKVPDIEFLGQGTLYPDVVESVSAFGGPSDVIKTHHNVGGLPDRMRLQLVEPLRDLFKDEVRVLGRELGLPSSLVDRQPFPGPGFAIRVIGEVTTQRCARLRRADAIVREEIERSLREGSLKQKLWQYFAVLLPTRSVGVMGDARTYGETVVVRIVESSDGMTADWVEIPKAILGRIASRINNEVAGVSRVLYDISSKPPSTIEWE